MVEWGRDALRFVLEVFGPGYEKLHGEKLVPEKWQETFLRALASEEMIALAASKGVGKSTGEAWAIWWFLATRYDSQVICTSITHDNLVAGLWKELGVWYALAPVLQRMFEFNGESIVAKRDPKEPKEKDRARTWWCKARAFAKDADATQQKATLAGFHGKKILYVGDEVGDYPLGVIIAAEAVRADEHAEARILLAGNTTKVAGPLYRAVHNKQNRYKVIRISGDPDDPNRCTRVSLEYARAMIDEHGRDHPWVKINILGEFPDVQSDKLLGPDEVDKAMRRDYRKDQFIFEPNIVGIDTALQGDDQTTMCRRQGPIVFRLRAWRESNVMTLTDQIAGQLIAWHSETPIDMIFVDTGGPSGFAILHGLQKMGFPAQGVDFGSDPVGNEPLAPLFGNRRAEMHWKAAKWVKEVGSLPDDNELRAEMLEPTYSVETKGKQTRYWVDPKAEIKERLGRSPDRHDGFLATFAVPVVSKQQKVLAMDVAGMRLDRSKTSDPFAVLGGRT